MAAESLADRFKATFDVDIQPYSCFHGFDILKFDAEFVKSRTGCMSDAVRSRFGDDAETLMQDLCKVGHPMEFYA